MRGLESGSKSGTGGWVRAVHACWTALALVALQIAAPPALAGVTARTATFVDGPAAERSDLGRQVRCMALVAYAEAAIDGTKGMDAVVRVIRNRMKSASFPSDACKVVLQPNQFQPVSQNASLREVLADPEAYPYSAAFGSIDPDRMSAAVTTASAALAGVKVKDPTVGALFFVNPFFMDADKCPWFAGLKKTAEIGGHVFMTEYASNEKHADPAIDCSVAGTGKMAANGIGQPLPRSVGMVLRDGDGRWIGRSRQPEDRRRVTVVLGGRIDTRVSNSLIAAR
ncbi:Cell Wall Hydrolase [Arboricoccus pini]|uniref:Cell Wall Hydrolase n=1 Tax=Arboricoccus pini TaxID=1963835 RepID=A0A212R645_9PROT|nr:cell wall hydrolase [Arboricoccus pini]SNB67613.1 Cell Wall Hydrolase [Arboricoccus pini]